MLPISAHWDPATQRFVFIVRGREVARLSWDEASIIYSDLHDELGAG